MAGRRRAGDHQTCRHEAPAPISRPGRLDKVEPIKNKMVHQADKEPRAADRDRRQRNRVCLEWVKDARTAKNPAARLKTIKAAK